MILALNVCSKHWKCLISSFFTWLSSCQYLSEALLISLGSLLETDRLLLIVVPLPSPMNDVVSSMPDSWRLKSSQSCNIDSLGITFYYNALSTTFNNDTLVLRFSTTLRGHSNNSWHLSRTFWTPLPPKVSRIIWMAPYTESFKS